MKLNSCIKIFTENGAETLMGYMLIVLVGGIILVTTVNKKHGIDNMFIRKLFHILAFFLLTPGAY